MYRNNTQEQVAACLGCLLVLVAIGFVPWVFMALWNLLLPSLFGWPQLSYWQALGIWVLLSIVGGCFRAHVHSSS